MANARSSDSDPFADHVSADEERAAIVESTLSVGRNATLTLGTDTVIVLGKSHASCPLYLDHRCRYCADQILMLQMKEFTIQPQEGFPVAACFQKVSLSRITNPQLPLYRRPTTKTCYLRRNYNHSSHTLLQYSLGRNRQE